MAKELRTDKFCIGIAFTFEIKEKLMLKYAEPGEKFGSVVLRVCESLVKDVKLPKKTLDKIRDQIAANVERRMKKRDEQKAKRREQRDLRKLKSRSAVYSVKRT